MYGGEIDTRVEIWMTENPCGNWCLNWRSSDIRIDGIHVEIDTRIDTESILTLQLPLELTQNRPWNWRSNWHRIHTESDIGIDMNPHWNWCLNWYRIHAGIVAWIDTELFTLKFTLELTLELTLKLMLKLTVELMLELTLELR